MAPSLGRITAQLAEQVGKIPSELIDLINRNIGPPTPLSDNDVYIRAMYVVSDQVNSYGGRFPVEEHERLASLLVDSPVLAGHRKDKLPLGRTFHALTMKRGDENWVKSYFYWLKGSEKAHNLKENIDAGIYKECSIAFTYHLPECSICGKDIRQCSHEPFQEYQSGNGVAVCHYNYREIEKVLETSLVYRGALPETSVSRELAHPNEQDKEPLRVLVKQRLSTINDLSILNEGTQYLVVPRYEGIPVSIELQGDQLSIRRSDKEPIDHAGIVKPDAGFVKEGETRHALLVGFKGKERCRLDQLEKHLAGEPSNVSRIVYILFPDTDGVAWTPPSIAAHRNVRIIPHRISGRRSLHRQALEIKSRDGVEIWPPGSSLLYGPAYTYQPSLITSPVTAPSVVVTNQNRGNRIVIQHPDLSMCFEIVNLDLNRLLAGWRFVADRIYEPSTLSYTSSAGEWTRKLTAVSADGDAAVLTMTDRSPQRLLFRPIVLDGKQRYLVYAQTN